MFERLQEAAVASENATCVVVLVLTPLGVKVWAPRHGRKTVEVLTSWDDIEHTVINPLLAAITQVEALV